jgi:hypothetical protein
MIISCKSMWATSARFASSVAGDGGQGERPSRGNRHCQCDRNAAGVWIGLDCMVPGFFFNAGRFLRVLLRALRRKVSRWWARRRVRPARLAKAPSIGRRCCGVELDPLYVDVTLRRYEVLTGKVAVSETGEKLGAQERGFLPRCLGHDAGKKITPPRHTVFERVSFP